MHKVSIIGAGVVGTAMGYLLKRSGYPIIAIASLKIESAERAREFIGDGEASIDPVSAARKADIIFITTPDSAIEEVCLKIASNKGFKEGAIVFHMSGALSSEVLESARKAGAKVGSMHPLQSLADVNKAVKNIPGSYFCIEGDKDAISAAKEIVATLNGKEISIDADKKTLYHAGASVASNFLVATVRFGLELFEAAGITKEDSLKALMPLIKGTATNIENLGIPKALTGPISRGDKEIVKKHINAINKEKPERMALYRELAIYTVKVAIEKETIKEKEAEEILSLLDKHKENQSS